MRRGRALAAGLSGALVLVTAWWWSHRPPATVTAATSSTQASAEAPAGPALPPAEQPGTPASQPAPATAVRPAASAPAVGVWDLCGIGRLPKPVGASAAANGNDVMQQLPSHLGVEATAAALERTLAVLDRGDARQRAAAVVLRGSDEVDRSGPEVLRDIARTTNDPVVAQWALDRCKRALDCRQSMAERWSQLEPDNAAAWLSLIQEQPQRRVELMRRLLPSGRFDVHSSALIDTVAQAIPPDVLPYVQINVWMYAIGVEAAMSWPNLDVLGNRCRTPLPAGGERQAECRALADVMMNHSDSVVVTQIGTRLAEAAGLPRRDAEARRAELNRLQQQLGHASQGPQPYSCAAFKEFRSLIEQRARVGEVEALRAWAAASAPR